MLRPDVTINECPAGGEHSHGEPRYSRGMFMGEIVTAWTCAKCGLSAVHVSKGYGDREKFYAQVEKLRALQSQPQE